jgi:LVIVD repeat
MKLPGGVRFGAVFVAVVGALALWAGPSIGVKLFQSEPLKNPKPYKKETRATVRVPETADIPRRGIAVNFKVVGHNPLLDGDRGGFRDRAFDPYVNPPLNIPRGSNADITVAGDCVYVGSFVGYQTALIVDVSKPSKPDVVGEVPGLPPGVGNGIEGIEASDNLLVVDQRTALGGLGFPIPADTGLQPTFRGITIYDIGRDGSNCRRPRLVGRYAYRSNSGLPDDFVNTHLFSLWRDPLDRQRVLALQSFSPANYLNGVRSNDPAAEPLDPVIQVIDLTGCPRECDPRNVANWSAELQYGRDKYGNPREHLHEATMSTDGNRIHMSQYRDGFFLLDSSLLLKTLRGQATCDPAMPTTETAPTHCLKPLNADYEARDDTAPPLSAGWHHTPTRVPDRPFVFEGEESGGPSVAATTVDGRRVVDQPLQIASSCPGSFLRMIYVGEKEYFGQRTGGTLLRGDLFPKAVGYYGTEEQNPENCGPNGFKPGTAPLTSSWFSPHDGITFPNLAIWTYYGAGVRAIDISNPFMLRESGAFINKPVDRVRWASYGDQGSDVPGGPGGTLRERPTTTPPAVFGFSYVVAKDGYLIYADVHSGLYVLRYRGPHKREIPNAGSCMSGNPGAIRPGYEPCPPYGRWDDPRNSWTETGVTTPPGEEPH